MLVQVQLLVSTICVRDFYLVIYVYVKKKLPNVKSN